MGGGSFRPSASPLTARDSFCPRTLFISYNCCHVEGNTYLQNKTKSQILQGCPRRENLGRSGFNFIIKGAPKAAEDQKAIFKRSGVCKGLLPRPEFQNLRGWRERVLPEYLLRCQEMAFPSRMRRASYTSTGCHTLYMSSFISTPTSQENNHIL